MPELPEVETIVRGLREDVPGRRIVGVRLGKTDFMDDPATIERELPGRRISSITRLGKFILLGLQRNGAEEEGLPRAAEADSALIVHLGMTGHLSPRDVAEPLAPHTHVQFRLDDGRELRYTDPRRFGRMLWLPGSQLADFRGALGLDPLSAPEAEFVARLASRRARVKALLLDQHVFAGMGNIYADESLWRARIHPARLACTLSRQQMRALFRAVQRVLADAIRWRGSSISDYLDAQGFPGEYQQRHRVYRRTGKKCYRCLAKIRSMVVAGRTSHFCPRCQPAPRKR